MVVISIEWGTFEGWLLLQRSKRGEDTYPLFRVRNAPREEPLQDRHIDAAEHDGDNQTARKARDCSTK